LVPAPAIATGSTHLLRVTNRTKIKRTSDLEHTLLALLSEDHTGMEKVFDGMVDGMR
jgi:hypothetical protein